MSSEIAKIRCADGVRPTGRQHYGPRYIANATQALRSRRAHACMETPLEAMLAQFPFYVQGFHSDNGSEFINHTVAKLLNKLLIEQTKSRPRCSNDNGLVESKNGAVVRKRMGCTRIAAPHTEQREISTGDTRTLA